VRDGDLFDAIGRGTASIETDEIETFTERGIRLRSGRELEADLVVTATGLNLQLLGGVPLEVDGKPIAIEKTTMYKGAMLSDVPNLALSVGYVNASWTLRSDLVCRYVCRVLNEMDRRGSRTCTARRGDDAEISDEPILPLSAGYVKRALGSLPQQGAGRPWKIVQSYLGDVVALRYATVEDGALRLEP
jgi:cation diffusion facilitator CzcD-associated flavoprotein CzcO